MSQFERTQELLGQDAIQKLQNSNVIVFGVGGVGGYVVEALVRAGIGEISIVDNDTVSESNLNRQIIALHSTIGRAKVDVVEERALDINPNLKIHKHNTFVLPENLNQFDLTKYDYIVDCIDTVSTKIALIEKLATLQRQNFQFSTFNFPFITCLGTGNKLDPMAFKVSTIEKTSVCPLARVMRRELKARGISGVKCVYSEEEPRNVVAQEENGRHAPGSVSFVPAAAGLLIAGTVVKDLIAREN